MQKLLSGQEQTGMSLEKNPIHTSQTSTKSSDSALGSDGITNSVYKKLWSIVGLIILDAWKFSCVKGVLPPSHKESIITLLLKEGKNIKDIKNWGPITLSNCDSKIITKTLALRVSKASTSFG